MKNSDVNISFKANKYYFYGKLLLKKIESLYYRKFPLQIGLFVIENLIRVHEQKLIQGDVKLVMGRKYPLFDYDVTCVISK